MHKCKASDLINTGVMSQNLDPMGWTPSCKFIIEPFQGPAT